MIEKIKLAYGSEKTATPIWLEEHGIVFSVEREIGATPQRNARTDVNVRAISESPLKRTHTAVRNSRLQSASYREAQHGD